MNGFGFVYLSPCLIFVKFFYFIYKRTVINSRANLLGGKFLTTTVETFKYMVDTRIIIWRVLVSLLWHE